MVDPILKHFKSVASKTNEIIKINRNNKEDMLAAQLCATVNNSVLCKF